MMRLVVTFARPLDRDAQTRLMLAAAALAKTSRVRVRRGAYEAEVFGEAVGSERLRAALAAEGLTPERIDTSLDQAADQAADDLGDGSERVRAIGR
jgi:hypothetical protein